MLLLANLDDSIIQSFINVNMMEVHLHTDASNFLFWLHTPSHRFKTYVANRIIQILDLTPLKWSHITESNPADIASCGSTATALHRSDFGGKDLNFTKETVLHCLNPVYLAFQVMDWNFATKTLH